VKTIEAWRYLGMVHCCVVALIGWGLEIVEARRARRRVRELEKVIRSERPGNLVQGGRRLGGGIVFLW
jgi:hypothetical protein